MKRDRGHLQQQQQQQQGGAAATTAAAATVEARGVGRTGSLPLEGDHVLSKRIKREPTDASSEVVSDPIPHGPAESTGGPPLTYPPPSSTSSAAGLQQRMMATAHPSTGPYAGDGTGMHHPQQQQQQQQQQHQQQHLQLQLRGAGGHPHLPPLAHPHPGAGGGHSTMVPPGAPHDQQPPQPQPGPGSTCTMVTVGGPLALAPPGAGYSVIHPGPNDIISASYRGEFKDDKPHGRGYKMWIDGDWYEGEWRNGKQHGRGVYCCPSGRRYEGEWKDGVKHGRGVKTWANGDRYEGEWRDGKQHGKGIYTWANGDRYEGEWKDGNLHGKGIKTWWNDNRYEGEWLNDVKHGHGTKTWANGDKYEGQWRDGTKHGRGTYTWANGDKYIGDWKDDKKHGKGIFCFANGRKKEGTWENDLKHGAFTFTDERGKVFSQIYEEGKLISSTLKHDAASTNVPTFAQFVTSAQHWFTVFEENQKQLDEKNLELDQLRLQNASRESLEQELRARIKELQVKLRMVQDENARLIGGGSENCSLEELQVLERTLERSRTLVSTRISILNSRVALAEKSRCMQCAERSKEVVFVPCGHRSFCQMCAVSVIVCPVCETPVASKVISYDT